MKMGKKLLLGLLAAAFCLSLAACGEPDSTPSEDTAGEPEQSTPAPELQEFTSDSGSFSIRVPEIEGGWTQTPGGNEEHLVLDNQDQSLSVLVQGLPKGSEQFADLDSLVTFYRAQTLSGFGEPTAENVAVASGLTAQAESYTATRGDVTAKALVVFIEGANEYYVYTITGIADVYDAEIDGLRDAVASFAENAG